MSSSCPPDSITLRSVLRACLQCNDCILLAQIHACIIKLQPLFSTSELTVLNTCLLNVYLSCGCTELAHKVFVTISDRDVVAYTSMLKGFAEDGRSEEAFGVFKEMVESNDVKMNEHVYSCALNACAGVRYLLGGRQIHAHVVKSMMGLDVFVGTGLVDLYVKCNEMKSARMAFSEIVQPNVVSYNALLAGNLKGNEGLQLFSDMRLLGMSPDNVTFASVLRGCKDVSILSVAQLHGLVVKMMEVELDVFLSCALFEAYIDMGCVAEAHTVFCRMEEKDDAAYNLVIQGYLRNGHESEAVESFIEALMMGKEVREVNATSLFVSIGGLNQGKQLHSMVIKFGRCDTPIVGSLIGMYAKQRHLEEAIKLFDQIPSPDIVSWTDLISNFSECGEFQGALKFYVKMTEDGLAEPPNCYTFSTVLRSCAHLTAALEGKQIHAQIIKSNVTNIQSDAFVASALLSMYSRCGYIEEARRLFKDMPERDLASWNAMITSLAQHGLVEEAIETFQELLNEKDIEPNHITFVGVLTACSHGGMVELGYRYFRSIKQPTVDHYACLISLVARAGRLDEALDLVEEMPYEANEIIWSSLLAASSKYGNVELGEYSADKLLELNPVDPGTYVALSNIYASAGRWEDMKQTRRLMKKYQADFKRPGISWIGVSGEKLTFSAAGVGACA